jgi:hypothetical protein
MLLLDVAHIAYHLYDLARDSRRFLQESYPRSGQGGIETAAFNRRTYRRVVWVAGAVVAAGWVAVPCAAPWVAWWVRGITPRDASFRMALGVLISTGPVPLYVFSGASVGCLTAPSSFLRGPAGARWMQVFGGTRSVVTHRVFCVLAALTGFVVMIVFAVFVICMAPTVK